MGLLILILFLLILIPICIGIFTIICNWIIFKKAGKEGWEAIVPIYNTIVLIEISGLPLWYIALYFIPFANIYVTIKVYIELSRKFKQSGWFGVGLLFLTPIFLGILAFDKSVVYEKIANAYCSNCGNNINSDDKFCVRCGKQI